MGKKILCSGFSFMLLATLSGCSGGGPWDVFRFYEGPPKSVESVAVVSLFYVVYPGRDSRRYTHNAFITQIDGRNASRRFSLDTTRSFPPFEYHILPGLHSFNVSYRASARERDLVNVGNLSFQQNVEAGQVYVLEYKLYDDDTKWNAWLKKAGSVTELAPEIYNIRYNVSPTREISYYSTAPAHWTQLAERGHQLETSTSVK